MENILIKYVRDEENNPVGCIMSFGKNELSWSLLNPKDKFDKKKAKYIAHSRFLHSKKLSPNEPLNYKYWVSHFKYRKGYLGENPNPYTTKLLKELKEQEERSIKYFQ